MDELLKAKLSALAACVCEKVTDSAGFCFCGVLPGEEWYDLTEGCDSETCGMAWVRVAGMYMSTEFGQQDLELNNCNKGVGLELEVGVVRCFPTEEDGSAPDQATLLAGSDQQMEDAVNILRAIECCESFDDYLIGLWSPIGPEGGSYGGAWTVTVGVI